MTSTTRRIVLSEAVRKLEHAGVSNPHRNAEWMLSDVIGCSLASLYANFDEPVSDQEKHAFESMVARRAKHEPLQYVQGYAEFYGLRVTVTPDVLIPRPETEQVVERALALIADVASPRVFDVGTGSGCIALAIKSKRSDASVWGCDVSEPALKVARMNATANGLAVDFLNLDALASDFSPQAPANLDLLISNPPYVAESEAASLPTDVFEYEPHVALFAREDPLVFYRKLADDARCLLEPGGWLVLETHADFAEPAEELVLSYGFQDVERIRDYADRSRILIGRWQPNA